MGRCFAVASSQLTVLRGGSWKRSSAALLTAYRPRESGSFPRRPRPVFGCKCFVGNGLSPEKNWLRFRHFLRGVERRVTTKYTKHTKAKGTASTHSRDPYLVCPLVLCSVYSVVSLTPRIALDASLLARNAMSRSMTVSELSKKGDEQASIFSMAHLSLLGATSLSFDSSPTRADRPLTPSRPYPTVNPGADTAPKVDRGCQGRLTECSFLALPPLSCRPGRKKAPSPPPRGLFPFLKMS